MLNSTGHTVFNKLIMLVTVTISPLHFIVVFLQVANYLMKINDEEECQMRRELVIRRAYYVYHV